MNRLLRTVVLALMHTVGTLASATAVVPLNDTGQSACYDGTGATRSCSTTGADDGRYGRDAASAVGALIKTGAGMTGFDFTKLSNNGLALAADAALGSNPTDWACTKDNVTGLTWEVKTTSGLRSKAHAYTWYSSDTASNGGIAGTPNGGVCSGSDCDTQSFVAAVNATALCSYNDWRMPSLRELKSLVNFGIPGDFKAPVIDGNYFPNTQINWFWTANNYAADPAQAWYVYFISGSSNAHTKPDNGYVRLVRGAQ